MFGLAPALCGNARRVCKTRKHDVTRHIEYEPVSWGFSIDDNNEWLESQPQFQPGILQIPPGQGMRSGLAGIQCANHYPVGPGIAEPLHLLQGGIRRIKGFFHHTHRHRNAVEATLHPDLSGIFSASGALP